MTRSLWNRRTFLGTSSSLLAGSYLARCLTADERPPVTNPRATSGDSLHEPDWKQRLTITVGQKKADLVGTGDKVIQAAVDYMARMGGGTVRILPGTYRMRNAVYLRSGVHILGSGADSILKKEPSTTTKLAENSDWYDQEITMVDAKGFEVGDGICLKTRNPHNQGTDTIKRTLIARSGNRFKLDRAPRKNFWLAGEPTVSTLFPILSGEEIENVRIENIVLDGNRKNNANLNGNYAGCIFLQDCNRITMRGVETRFYNGDGMSWQICHDVVVENCYSHDNADLGLHPGSGSQRPLMRNNRIQRNKIGIFFCWGVKYGLAEKNQIDGSGNYGISIGHNDTDNLIRHNVVKNSGQVGVLFRTVRIKEFSPHRNRLENNTIINSGAGSGVGVDLQGQVENVSIRGNKIQETRQPMQRIGVRIGPETKDIRLADNHIEGFSKSIVNNQ